MFAAVIKFMSALPPIPQRVLRCGAHPQSENFALNVPDGKVPIADACINNVSSLVLVSTAIDFALSGAAGLDAPQR